ncbi:MAG TPA: alpha-hydroxy acid oxidase [Streptosporangiaceae bacterium]|nr:alpha-hydroxy acid oxidase [Streptosporangiaceae bacterium]
MLWEESRGGGLRVRGDDDHQEAGRAAAVPLSLPEAEPLAAASLPPEIWDFVAGGSGAELTLAANRAALDQVYLLPRVLTDVSACSTRAQFLGGPAAMPVAIAPMAYQRLVHADGELGLARAALAAGIPFTAGMLSSYPIEQIAAIGGDIWLQLYWLRDRDLTAELVRRAEQAGCRGLMLTVDVPRMGRRLRDLRNGFAFPPGVTAANLETGQAMAGHASVPGASAVARHTAAIFDPSLSWPDIEWLRERSALPLILKGVLDPGDARRAADLGVDGLVVSNHGGRQLDGAAPSITALPDVCAAVGGRCEVILDSGIRSGTDVLRALALGASGVLLGRPALWGLARGGASGARQLIGLLQEELQSAMMLAGCPDVASAAALRTAGGGR